MMGDNLKITIQTLMDALGERVSPGCSGLTYQF